MLRIKSSFLLYLKNLFFFICFITGIGQDSPRRDSRFPETKKPAGIRHPNHVDRPRQRFSTDGRTHNSSGPNI